MKTAPILALLLASGGVSDANAAECATLKLKDESELVRYFLNAPSDERLRCLAEDPLRRETLQISRMLYVMVARLEGLPRPFRKAWSKMLWSQFDVYSVPFPLCLTDGNACPEADRLVAKNYHRRRKAIIFADANLWRRLSLEEKFSLLWHEVLGHLNVEVDSYRYSSLVEFSTECESPSNASAECFIVAKIQDPSFVRP